MMRKRNDLFGSIQSHLAQRRVARPKSLSKDWWRDASLGEREKALKKSYGFKAKDARFLADSSYSSVFGDRAQNPRVFPGNLPPLAEQSLRRLIRGKDMAQKKPKSKKKKNGRKRAMPAGLRAYWAKKRAAKAKRRKNSKSRPFIGPDGKVWHSSGKGRPKKSKKKNPRRRSVPKVRSYRKPARKTVRRKRRSNPRPRVTIRIKAPYGLSGKGLRKYRAMAAKAYGAPARIVQK